jgi:hypothetical protein
MEDEDMKKIMILSKAPFDEEYNYRLFAMLEKEGIDIEFVGETEILEYYRVDAEYEFFFKSINIYLIDEKDMTLCR